MTIYSQRICGVEFYPWQWRFEAIVIPGEASATVTVKPLEHARQLKSEWWRRAGWYLVARPYQFAAWHGWYRWTEVTGTDTEE